MSFENLFTVCIHYKYHTVIIKKLNTSINRIEKLDSKEQRNHWTKEGVVKNIIVITQLT